MKVLVLALLFAPRAGALGGPPARSALSEDGEPGIVPGKHADSVRQFKDPSKPAPASMCKATGGMSTSAKKSEGSAADLDTAESSRSTPIES